jgi:release factor glutamine methyltransferase
MQTVGKLIKSFKTHLSDIYPDYEIKAIYELVFEYVLGFSKADLIVNHYISLSDNEISRLEEILTRLVNHEPVQYVIGETFFYNGRFRVNPGVLIPRPETEELVHWILSKNTTKSGLKVLDIGTGSGCIAISLVLNLKNPTVWACDISDTALRTAGENAIINQAAVSFFQMDILKPLQSNEMHLFDIIVSNPPYVLKSEMKMMRKNVLVFEPHLALFVENNDPLLFYKAIISFCGKNLKHGGSLYFEINEALGGELEELLENSGFKEIELHQDMHGKNRMIFAKKGDHG